jgi:bacterioferritin-associated ferredoxin
MAAVFIFARDIQDAVKEGKREIEIPDGARISSAAFDLIRESQIQITYVTPQAEESDVVPLADETPVEKKAESIPEPASEATDASAACEVTESDIEEIARRVIERFREIKGLAPAEEERAPSDDDDLVICRCEEITKGEIKEAIRNGMKTLNGIKRITRAGMGLCQGETCQRLVTQILAGELGVSPAEVEPATARAPVRPLRLSVFATG